MAEIRTYGGSTTILFPLIDAGAQDFESTPVTFAAGDTQISKDEGAFGNTSNNPSHEGNGIYSLVLTSAEMQAARIMVTIIDQTATKAWEDQAVYIETRNHPSAQHGSAPKGSVETTIATLASQTSFTLTDGSADDDAYNGWLAVIEDASTANQIALGIVSDYTGSSKTITLAADPGIFTMAVSDLITLVPPQGVYGINNNRVIGDGNATPWDGA